MHIKLPSDIILDTVRMRDALKWGHCSRINKFSRFLIVFAIALSALPEETVLLTEPGWPMASLAAIHSLLIEVWVLKRMASWILRPSLFFRRKRSTDGRRAVLAAGA